MNTKSGNDTICLKQRLGVESNPFVYGAQFVVVTHRPIIEISPRVSASFGGRPPHLDLYSLKLGLQGSAQVVTLHFQLRDYPLGPGESLELECIFTLGPDSK